MSIDSPVVLVTDPGPKWTPGDGTQLLLQRLDDRLTSFELCGRSWQERPKDLNEFIFNTFKPIFCAGRKTLSMTPSQQLLHQVHWYVATTGGDLLAVHRDNSTEYSMTFSEAILKSRLLVLASSRATRALLGSSVRVWYQRHVERDHSHDHDSPIYLKDVDLTSDSPLASVNFEVRGRIEVVVFPSPIRGGQTKVFFTDGDAYGGTFNDLRTNNLRRVHMALGCEQHAIW